MSEMWRRVATTKVRASEEGATVSGVAVRWDSPQELHSGLREQVAAGAFDGRMDDVRLLVGHAHDRPALARTASGTLSVQETSEGLEFSARLDASSPDAQSAMSAIRRGDLDGVSIGFSMGDGSRMDETKTEGGTLRTISQVGRLWELSLVNWPAYKDTSVALRGGLTPKEASMPKVEVKKPQTLKEWFTLWQSAAERNDPAEELIFDKVTKLALEAQEARDIAPAQEEREAVREFAEPGQVVVRAGGNAPGIRLGTASDAEPTDAQLQSRRRIVVRAMQGRAITGDERRELHREWPGDRLFETFLRAHPDERPAIMARLRTWEQRLAGLATRAAANPLTTVTAATGGALIPEGFVPTLIRFMAATGPMADPSFTRRINTSMGNDLPWPRNRGHASVKAGIVAENVDSTPTLMSFDQVTFRAWKYTHLIVSPIELLQDEMVNLAGEIIAELAMAHGRAINEHFTVGTGTGQPRGIATTMDSSRKLRAGTAGSISDGEFIDLEHRIDPAYRMGARFAVQMHDDTFRAVRRFTDSDGQYRLQADYADGPRMSISGIPIRINQALERLSNANRHTVIIMGDHSQFVTRMVMGFRISVSDEAFFTAQQRAYIGVQRCDSGYINDNALAGFENR